MRFHEKVGLLRSLRPDVAVVAECACPEVLLRRAPAIGTTGFEWTGARPSKGLAVLAFGAWRLEREAAVPRHLGNVLPVRVEGPASFRLLAIWHAPRRRRSGSPRDLPLGTALEVLTPFLAERPVVVAGDFNRALLTSRRDGSRAPSRLARRIEAMGLASAYHAARGVALGEEPEPTLFVHRGLSWRRHVDFVFVGRETLPSLRAVGVGPALPWILASDHAPVVVDVETA